MTKKERTDLRTVKTRLARMAYLANGTLSHHAKKSLKNHIGAAHDTCFDMLVKYRKDIA